MQKYLLSLLIVIFGMSIIYGQKQKLTTAPDNFAEAQITIDSNRESPANIYFMLGKQPAVQSFFANYQQYYGLSTQLDFRTANVHTDNIGRHHRVNQYYDGIQIIGAQYVLHEKNGAIWHANGHLIHQAKLGTAPVLSEAEALTAALKEINAEKYKWENSQNNKQLKSHSASYYPKGILKITSGRNALLSQHLKLVYRFDIYAEMPLGRYWVDVDAKNGDIVNVIDRIHHADVAGSGTSQYNGSVNMTVRESSTASTVAAVNALANWVSSLVITGKLTSRQARSLGRVLYQAKSAYERGRISNGDRKMGAFISRVNRLIDGGDLDATDGNQLIEYATNIISESEPNIYLRAETTRGAPIRTFDMKNDVLYENAVNFTAATPDGPWDPVGVSAHWGTEVTYDYFYNNFNRNSLDDNGFPLLSYVHYGFNYSNAFWDGERMTYGDGDGIDFNSMAGLDVVSHEITHGVTEFSSGLNYYGESGALNESFSDIFGNLVEFEVEGIPGSGGTGSWLMGEDVTSSGAGIRNMANPNAFDDPDTYLGNFWSYSGHVHTNSGVQNKWFYILAVGESGTNDNGYNYSITGIGIANAATIAYHTNNSFLTPSSVYADARSGSIACATSLFGASSPEALATAAAWDAVGVTSSGTSKNSLSSSASVGSNSSLVRTPDRFELDQNYPNPFNPATTIGFSLPEATTVTLQVFNTTGQLVQTLFSGNLDAGFHNMQWGGNDQYGRQVASGIYLYRLQAGSYIQSRKMILLK